MFEMLISLIFTIIKIISSVILTPILLLIESFFPSLDSLIVGTQEFLNDYIFVGARFVKNMFMSMTGFPQQLFTFIASYMLLKIGLHISMQGYKFILKMWERFKP